MIEVEVVGEGLGGREGRLIGLGEEMGFGYVGRGH